MNGYLINPDCIICMYHVSCPNYIASANIAAHFLHLCTVVMIISPLGNTPGQGRHLWLVDFPEALLRVNKG